MSTMDKLTEKICLVFQPLGIGDVFYTQAIGQHYADKGYRVIWPLAPQIMYIKDYISYPGIEFVNKEVDFPRKDYYIETNPMVLEEDFVFLPLANASHRVHNSTTMHAKYALLGLDPGKWRDAFNFTRNKVKEDELYYNVLGLNDDSVYVFLNKKYGTPPYTTEAPIAVETDYPILELSYLENYTLFDWLKVIENSAAIITVDTSFQYLIDKLNLKTNIQYCYPRNGRETLTHIRSLFNTPWTYLDLNNNQIIQ